MRPVTQSYLQTSTWKLVRNVESWSLSRITKLEYAFSQDRQLMVMHIKISETPVLFFISDVFFDRSASNGVSLYTLTHCPQLGVLSSSANSSHIEEP